MTLLVTGGAGFIGSHFIDECRKHSQEPLVVLDLLTYAGTRRNVQKTLFSDVFIEGDISDRNTVSSLLATHKPRAIVHFAAETHVDRSVESPEVFVQTNIVGTFNLLQETLIYWKTLPQKEKTAFLFLHISTDEVYGETPEQSKPYEENQPYSPRNPYASTKAASDHLVRSFHQTYELPIVIAHSSNNYGPRQFPEKFIPRLIGFARNNCPLPLHGDGQASRDWIFVTDNCRALWMLLERGKIGQSYNISSQKERSNRSVAEELRTAIQACSFMHTGISLHHEITLVPDRICQDRRYALSSRKIRDELGWAPTISFQIGLQHTVQWYLENPDWWPPIVDQNH